MPTPRIQHQSATSILGLGVQPLRPRRIQAGVRAQRVRRPVDDPNYVVIDLDFDSTDEAVAFRRFLETQVWTVRDNAPALVGSPETMILESAEME